MARDHQLIAYHSPTSRCIPIADAQRGLACGCACLGCGEPLVAKQGDKNAWHFSHHVRTDCPGGLETLLHLAGKQVLEEEGIVAAPAWDLHKLESYRAQLGHHNPPLEVLNALQQLVKLKEIASYQLGSSEAEIYDETSGLKPDITTTIHDQKCFIEILVTHACDEDKRRRLSGLNIPTLEISLAHLRSQEFDMRSIRDAIQGNRSEAKWLVKPAWIQEARYWESLIESWLSELDKKREEERISMRKAWENAYFNIRDGKKKEGVLTITKFGQDIRIVDLDGLDDPFSKCAEQHGKVAIIPAKRLEFLHSELVRRALFQRGICKSMRLTQLNESTVYKGSVLISNLTTEQVAAIIDRIDVPRSASNAPATSPPADTHVAARRWVQYEAPAIEAHPETIIDHAAKLVGPFADASSISLEDSWEVHRYFIKSPTVTISWCRGLSNGNPVWHVSAYINNGGNMIGTFIFANE